MWCSVMFSRSIFVCDTHCMCIDFINLYEYKTFMHVHCVLCCGCFPRKLLWSWSCSSAMKICSVGKLCKFSSTLTYSHLLNYHNYKRFITHSPSRNHQARYVSWDVRHRCWLVHPVGIWSFLFQVGASDLIEDRLETTILIMSLVPMALCHHLPLVLQMRYFPKKGAISPLYPLVKVYITMENHHVS